MTSPWIRRVGLPGILAAALALRLLFFTGIQGNDDVSYYAGAWRICHGVTLPKDDLLQTRLAYVAPVAALFGLFGTRISCLIFPSLLSSLVLVALAHWLGRERYSERVGRVAALFVALIPLDVFYATTSNTDVPLAVWLGLGTCLAWSAPRAASRGLQYGCAIAAGLCFGAAHLTKESAVILLLPLIPFLGARDHRRWLPVSAATFAAVVGGELFAYFLWTGNPFHRVAVARGIQGGIGAESFLSRLLILPSFCAGVRGPLFPYSGGLMAFAAAGCFWALRCDRERSGGLAAWWLGSGLILALLPLSLFPYRPVLHFQARMYAVLILPGAVLAAAWLVEVLGSAWPKVAWGFCALGILVALTGSARLHADAVAWRSGPEWAHEILKSRHEGPVVTDPRTGQMLIMLNGPETFYRVHRYQSSNLPPPPGTLLLQIDRLATASRDWDHVQPPAWWTEQTPRREVVAEQRRPGPWRLRGARGPDEVATLYRILPP